MQMFKIDVIFELTLWQQLDIRTRGHKQVFFEASIGIADILRCQREQHFFCGAVGAASGEEIEQVEKRALTAVCQCNILWFDIPTQRFPQHCRQKRQ